MIGHRVKPSRTRQVTKINDIHIDMKPSSILLIAAIVATSSVHAERRPSDISGELLTDFEAKSDTLGQRPIPYREAVIHPESSDSATLVIFLHSAGGRGTDNLAPLGMPATKKIHDYLQQRGTRAYMLVPQCPETASWNGVAPGSDRPRGNGSSPMRPLFGDKIRPIEDKTPLVRHIIPMIDRYLAEHPTISPRRIYILGASMGGAGVWELLAENPGRFRGAMIASGAYRGKSIDNILGTQVVCTAGTEENTYQKCRKLVERLDKAGGTATFIPLNGQRHVDACNNAFTPENLDILFGPRRE